MSRTGSDLHGPSTQKNPRRVIPSQMLTTFSGGVVKLGRSEADLEQVDGHDVSDVTPDIAIFNLPDATECFSDVQRPLQCDNHLQQCAQEHVLLDICLQTKTCPIRTCIKISVPVEIVWAKEHTRISDCVTDPMQMKGPMMGMLAFQYPSIRLFLFSFDLRKNAFLSPVPSLPMTASGAHYFYHIGRVDHVELCCGVLPSEGQDGQLTGRVLGQDI